MAVDQKDHSIVLPFAEAEDIQVTKLANFPVRRGSRFDLVIERSVTPTCMLAWR